MGPRPIVTVLILKPSALKKKKLARMLRALIQDRFSVVGLRLMRLTEFEAACLQCNSVRKVSDYNRKWRHT